MPQLLQLRRGIAAGRQIIIVTGLQFIGIELHYGLSYIVRCSW